MAAYFLHLPYTAFNSYLSIKLLNKKNLNGRTRQTLLYLYMESDFADRLTVLNVSKLKL